LFETIRAVELRHRQLMSLGARKMPQNGFRFQDLRHTFGIRLADVVDVVKIKELMVIPRL
jgi:hypothetical protein